jgi:hypothetical protein
MACGTTLTPSAAERPLHLPDLRDLLDLTDADRDLSALTSLSLMQPSFNLH